MAREKLYDSYPKQYNKLAKKADRRMRELERFSRNEEFKSILNYAYRTAVRDITQWTPPGRRTKTYKWDEDTYYEGPEKPRWQRDTPMDTNSLKAKIKDIERFLRKPTSTMTGTVKIYKKRTETINKKYGTQFTWQQLADYFESGIPDKANGQYGSKTVLIAIGEIQKNKKEVIDSLAKNITPHIQVDDASVQNAVNGLLANHGYKLEDVLD